MAVFISYSSRDRELLNGVLAALQRAREQVWLDEELRGGEAWWREILEQIRACDVFIIALSKHSLESKLCQAELSYARALDKQILPVQVGPLDSMRVNPLADMRIIDYQSPTVDNGIELITAVHAGRSGVKPLPDPPPEEPAMPFAYLIRLAIDISAEALPAEQQTALVVELRAGLEEDGDEDWARRDITQLLCKLRDRHDATYRTRAEADAVLKSLDRSPELSHAVTSSEAEQALPFHEDVQFTVYRPYVVRPGKWTQLLAFAHLGEPPLGADPSQDPIRQVEMRARALLGDQFSMYRPRGQDSSVGLPEDAEITFVLDLPDFDVDAPRRTFLWINAMHVEEFQIRAATRLHGSTGRGRLFIHHGIILLAVVQLAIRVDADAPLQSQLNEKPVSVAPYRKIFPSYSHADTQVVAEFERYVEALGDRYLRDVRELRAGEIWNERLRDFIQEADVFQLFWSHNAMSSPFVEQEWRYALSLRRPSFVRPTYWEEPMPKTADVPPVELGQIHFYPLGRTIPFSEKSQPNLPTAPPSVSPSPMAPPAYGQTAEVETGPPTPSPPGLDHSADHSEASGKPRRSPTKWLFAGVGAAAVVASFVIVAIPVFQQLHTAARPPSVTAGDTGAVPRGKVLTAAETRLLGELPTGYSASNCIPIRPPDLFAALAELSCGANVEPGGPSYSRFWLFTDDGSLTNGFNQSVAAINTPTPCAPGTTSATSWNNEANGASGQIACASYNVYAEVTWTNKNRMLLGEAGGSDIGSVFSWFGQYANN
jgi:hypothetical protein